MTHVPASLQLGRIVWAEIADARGYRKKRPAVIVTASEHVGQAGSFEVFCSSGKPRGSPSLDSNNRNDRATRAAASFNLFHLTSDEVNRVHEAWRMCRQHLCGPLWLDLMEFADWHGAALTCDSVESQAQERNACLLKYRELQEEHVRRHGRELSITRQPHQHTDGMPARRSGKHRPFLLKAIELLERAACQRCLTTACSGRRGAPPLMLSVLRRKAKDQRCHER